MCTHLINVIGTEKDRDFMRANGKKKEGDRNVLPPQIFNGDKFCGVSTFPIQRSKATLKVFFVYR